MQLGQRVIRLAILLAALVCVVILIAAGYSYITAAGDEQKIKKATDTLTYAIVGLVICFISVILVEFVLNNVLVAG
jgi:TRAP-type C4-dicarboxylate transport system permease small subunit